MHRWAFSTDAGPQIGQHSAPLDSLSASSSSFHGGDRSERAALGGAARTARTRRRSNRIDCCLLRRTSRLLAQRVSSLRCSRSSGFWGAADAVSASRAGVNAPTRRPFSGRCRDPAACRIATKRPCPGRYRLPRGQWQHSPSSCSAGIDLLVPAVQSFAGTARKAGSWPAVATRSTRVRRVQAAP